MNDLFSDTKDVVEKKWAKTVCKNFPAYASFWNEFIGIRTKKSSRLLFPNEYKLPKKWTKNEIKEYRHNIEELAMSHYSLFCNLAGAHFQLDECISALDLTQEDEKHFRFWESFEVCYQHMGNAINSFYFFWEKIFALTGTSINIRRESEFKRLVQDQIELYCKSKRKLLHFKKLKKEFGRKGQISIIRNNIVHFSRLASWSSSVNGKVFYFLPYKLQSNVRWKRSKQIYCGIMAHKKAQKHLYELEDILNIFEELAIDRLRTYLQTEGITIKYDNGN